MDLWQVVRDDTLTMTQVFHDDRSFVRDERRLNGLRPSGPAGGTPRSSGRRCSAATATPWSAPSTWTAGRSCTCAWSSRTARTSCGWTPRPTGRSAARRSSTPPTATPATASTSSGSPAPRTPSHP
ncbi:hypothetical protein ACFQZ4_22255 [Catellatospora coxensis]